LVNFLPNPKIALKIRLQRGFAEGEEGGQSPLISPMIVKIFLVFAVIF